MIKDPWSVPKVVENASDKAEKAARALSRDAKDEGGASVPRAISRRTRRRVWVKYAAADGDYDILVVVV